MQLDANDFMKGPAGAKSTRLLPERLLPKTTNHHNAVDSRFVYYVLALASETFKNIPTNQWKLGYMDINGREVVQFEIEDFNHWWEILIFLHCTPTMEATLVLCNEQARITRRTMFINKGKWDSFIGWFSWARREIDTHMKKRMGAP